jgi:hypothetical protein
MMKKQGVNLFFHRFLVLIGWLIIMYILRAYPISNFSCRIHTAASPPIESFGRSDFIVALRRNYKNRSLLKGFSLPAAAENYINLLHEKLLLPNIYASIKNFLLEHLEIGNYNF